MLLRFFCIVGGSAWSDTSFRYLQALTESGLPVRALSIDGSFWDVPTRWQSLLHTFQTPLSRPFVNIVCIPPRIMYGQELRGSDLAPPRPMSDDGEPMADAWVTAQGQKATTSVVYRPSYALCALWTAGCRNIAITCFPPIPSAQEIAALRGYDAVLCPDRKSARAITFLGAQASEYSPDRLKSEASSLPFLEDKACA